MVSSSLWKHNQGRVFGQSSQIRVILWKVACFPSAINVKIFKYLSSQNSESFAHTEMNDF